MYLGSQGPSMCDSLAQEASSLVEVSCTTDCRSPSSECAPENVSSASEEVSSPSDSATAFIDRARPARGEEQVEELSLIHR